MKRPVLLIVLFAMMVAASSNAQDSYREAVKDFMAVSGQLENAKSLVTTMSMLFDRSGDVDIDQLTKRFIDERLDEVYLDVSVPLLKSCGMTEVDLKELSSLYAMPEYKAFEVRQKAWMVDFVAYLMEPLMEMMKNASEGVYKDTGMAERLQTVQPNPDIDPAYAEKFNKVMLESPVVKSMKEAMIKRMDQSTSIDPDLTEVTEDAKDVILKSLPAILLNSAYGNLTLEDIDYAAKLYSNQAYSKLQTYAGSDDEATQTATQNLNYVDWMKEHGAKLSEDPRVSLEFYKALLGDSEEDPGK